MEPITKLTVKDLLEKEEYRIPIYQRNYAWGIEETTQLVRDVADYAKESPDSCYYIGSLIVFPQNLNNGSFYYETIDGQQRTTTLTILMCAIKHAEKHNIATYDMAWYSKVNISFDHREKSNATLWALFENNYTSQENADIRRVYDKAWSIIEKICGELELPIHDFIDYLLSKVIILRICVPTDTNLNHYFEIMNSRGEQLEQHEIVKAWLMEGVKDNQAEMATFNMIWEACANMDRYVQMNFSKDYRIQIFEQNGIGDVKKQSFENLVKAIEDKDIIKDAEDKSLYTLFAEAKNKVAYNKPWETNAEQESSDSYHALVTFSNFLLHALKIMRPKDSNVILDDKRLTKIFHTIIKEAPNKRSFAIEFITSLLKIRHLFDIYIIKRHNDKWSLKKLSLQKHNQNKHYYKATFSDSDSEDGETEDNHAVVMLLSMFHVSAPAQIYKHWMNAALLYVYENPNPSSKAYADYLWRLAKAYMLDRYLAKNDVKKTFEEIIYERNDENSNTCDAICWSNINIDECEQVGERVENFVLNFYDYCLWRKRKDSDFEFSYRTSVEHFYPQHPVNNKPMEFKYLHSFGNLCLVSRSMNSKFTNSLPEAKSINFGGAEEMKSYSLKLKDMMQYVKDRHDWNEKEINRKEEEAKDCILEALSY